MQKMDTVEIIDCWQAKIDGIAIGEANGIAIGEANGIAIGESKERKKNVMSLYSHDFEPLDIAKLLNISREEVDKIISGDKNDSVTSG